MPKFELRKDRRRREQKLLPEDNIFQQPRTIMLTSDMVKNSQAYKSVEQLIARAKEEQARELEELQERLRGLKEDSALMRGSLLEEKHQIWGMLTQMVSLEDRIEHERSEVSYEGESEQEAD